MKKILLLVDDEELVLKAISSQFEGDKVKVLTARDGEEGLKLALENHPDLILLDLVMPKLDGMTMLDRLRKDDWGKNVDVIILTNLGDAEKVSQAVEHGTFEYLVKVEWNINEVIKKIKNKLGL